MKIKGMLESWGYSLGISDTPTLTGKKQLEPIKDFILKSDEFSECEELIILDKPVRDDGKLVHTYKVNDGTKFKGKCYLYSLGLSPEMFDPNAITKPVKDGAAISPMMYNPETFLPLKQILLQISIQETIEGELYKKEVRELLEKVLENPKEYQIKGERILMVRGLFEEVTDSNNKK